MRTGPHWCAHGDRTQMATSTGTGLPGWMSRAMPSCARRESADLLAPSSPLNPHQVLRPNQGVDFSSFLQWSHSHLNDFAPSFPEPEEHVLEHLCWHTPWHHMSAQLWQAGLLGQGGVSEIKGFCTMFSSFSQALFTALSGHLIRSDCVSPTPP